MRGRGERKGERGGRGRERVGGEEGRERGERKGERAISLKLISHLHKLVFTPEVSEIFESLMKLIKVTSKVHSVLLITALSADVT